MAEAAGYRFEPVARQGLVLGLGPLQVLVACLSLVGAVSLFIGLPSPAGPLAAAVCLAGAVAVCRPVAGRPPLEWAAVAAMFAGRRRTTVAPPPAEVYQGPPGDAGPSGRPASSVETATAGGAERTGARDGAARRGRRRVSRRPVLADGVSVCELPAGGGLGPLGVVVDERTGAATALMRGRGGSFYLLDEAGQTDRLALWAGVLEALCTVGALARLQWCQMSLPATADGLCAHLDRHGRHDAPGFEGHRQLLAEAARKACRHETLLAVSVPCRTARGQPTGEGAELLRRQLKAVRGQMLSAGLGCDAALDAAAVGVALSLPFADGSNPPSPVHPWPLACREHWSALQVEGNWCRTYWVAEWPRARAKADFLAPVLTGRGQKIFSVVLAPVPAAQAAREAESARTSQLADARLRAEGGFLETARQRRQAEAVEERETELASGRGAFRFSGYLTVVAGDEAELKQACSEVEAAAGASRMWLRLLWGQQREALGWSLPLGRGL